MTTTSQSLHSPSHPPIAQPSPAQPSPAQPSPAQPSPAQPSPAQPSPAQPSPAQPSPAQPSPAQPSPAQPSPAQPSPAQPSPAQPSPAQPSPAQPSPAQPSPAQPSPAQPSPAQPSPAQPSPAQPSPAQPSPAQPSPAQPSPAQPSPAQPSPAQPSPAQPSPAQPSPAQPSPAQPSPAQPSPAQPSPAQPSPAQPSPAQPSPAQPSPAQPSPAQPSPAQPSPAQPSPAQPSPAQPSPAQPSPAQPSPAQPSPAQPSPAQPSPAQPSPAQPSPAQPSPAQPSPAQPSPAQPSPAQPSPAQPSPAQPSPAQPSPAQPSPAQPSPAQPSPAQPSPAQPSPAQPSPAQPSPAQPSPAQPSPAQPSPAQPSPAQPSPAQPSLTNGLALQRHVAVTLATWDAVWGEYLHPKWAEQRMRLYGAQEKVLERYFKKVGVLMLEEEAIIESQKRWGTRKQLVVFFGNAGIGTRGGWGAKAMLQACRKVMERANSGKPNGRVHGKVVTVDEFRTSRVSSAVNSPQPCEEELDRYKPTRPEGWEPQPGQVQHRLLRSAWSKRFEAPATPGDVGKWVDRDCNAALNLQRAGESKLRPLELCRWQHRGAAPAKGKEYPALGVKKLRDRAPKAQAQQPVAQLSAQTRLNSVASTLELTFLQASLPAKQVADMAPQGAEGLGVYMSPQGHVTASYPYTSRNQQVLGLDTLTGQFREETLVQISRADVITAGQAVKSRGLSTTPAARLRDLWQHMQDHHTLPLQLRAGPFPILGRNVVTTSIPIFFTNTSAEETWGSPRQATNCSICYNATTRTKWWGYVSIALDVDALLTDPSGLFLLNQLSDSNLHYRLATRPLGGVDDGLQTTVYESTSNSMSDSAVCRGITVVSDRWQLCVWPDSWEPLYTVPLVAVVVLVAALLSAAAFAVLLSRHQHKALLHSLLPRAAIAKLHADYRWATSALEDGAQAMVESGKRCGCHCSAGTLQQSSTRHAAGWALPGPAVPSPAAEPVRHVASLLQALLPSLSNGTPAELMMDILEAVLQSQPPALPKILAVRSCLQQSLDVYKPLQADLTQRMAQASHLDGEVREALMVQLLGRQDLGEAVAPCGHTNSSAAHGSFSPGPACAAAEQEVDILCAPAQLHPAANGSVGRTCASPDPDPASGSLTSPAMDQGDPDPPRPSHCIELLTCELMEQSAPPAHKSISPPPDPASTPPAASAVSPALQPAMPRNLTPVKGPRGRRVFDTSWMLNLAAPTPTAAAPPVLKTSMSASTPADATQGVSMPPGSGPLAQSQGSGPHLHSAPSAATLDTSPQQLPRRPPVVPPGVGQGPALAWVLQGILSHTLPELQPPGSGAALLADQAAVRGGAVLMLPTLGAGQEQKPELPSSWALASHSAGGTGQKGDGDEEQRSEGAAAAYVRPAQPRAASLASRAGNGAQGRSMRLLPEAKLRVPKAPLPEVEACLASADTWTFDAFALTQATEGHPLSVLAYWLLHQSGLAAWAQLDQVKLARWLCCIEDGYCANPYHNRSHAADVLQTMHMLLTRGGLAPGYADQQSMLAAYLAAVCHDYQHIGRTNDYLVQTQDELALRYNDRSPMENHHLAAAWSLLRVPQLNFLQALPQPAWDRLRKLVIELVLGTDMKQHFSIIGAFTALHRTAPDAQPASKAGGVLGLHTMGPSTASSDSPQDPHPVVGSSCNSHSERKVLQPLSEQDKLISLQMALKCSDLGHLAAPLPVHLAWVSRLEAEFFLQGDVERAAGLPLSPLCDRTKQGITKSQVGFFDFVALPLFNNFAARFTAAKPLLAGVMRNYRHWQAQAAAAAEPERRTPGGPGAARA
ncbi:hypothetical protein QJQ45_010053 [Haematococcus lacustris]|nr:hypothetical protein QJQ45_010053 [Haematococcus lacustris]